MFDDCVEDNALTVTLSDSLCVSIQTKNITVNSSEHPSFYPQVCTATFEDIRTLFKSDSYNVLKRAPKLTSKACWPSKLERQNVNLALKIFHDSTYCGLLTYKIEKGIVENNQTVAFLKLISIIWDIFNVNWVGKDIRFKNEYSAPLCPNDSRLSFIRKVKVWLNCWKSIPFKFGKLS